MPGLIVAAAGVAAAHVIAAPFPVLGPMVVAIVLGILAGNAGVVPAIAGPGLEVAGKRVLRIGIVLLGLRLSLHDVADLGTGMILTVVAVVAGGLACGMGIGAALGVEPRLRLLIACGFSICGAAAIAAVAGVLDGGKERPDQGAELRESVVAAVALVVVFGTIMIPALPALGHVLGLSGTGIGIWAGASVHEVAQVVAIGGSVGGAALGAAVVVKLGRVLMLAPVLAVVSIMERRRIRAQSGKTSKSGKSGASIVTGEPVTLPPVMPLFVAGFLAMVVIRSTGLVPVVVIEVAGVAEQWLLGAAMFALGTGVRASLLRSVGAAPFVMAALTTIVVASIGLIGVHAGGGVSAFAS
ncbi:YeiH family protein [Corynebacterium sp. NPDC060344]|uniref:YeiH family protein n=1 Tax=Corynebacterium sp. NPDC060344 TaxID=3347101 RepID=UPI003666DCFF